MHIFWNKRSNKKKLLGTHFCYYPAVTGQWKLQWPNSLALAKWRRDLHIPAPYGVDRTWAASKMSWYLSNRGRKSGWLVQWINQKFDIAWYGNDDSVTMSFESISYVAAWLFQPGKVKCYNQVEAAWTHVLFKSTTKMVQAMKIMCFTRSLLYDLVYPRIVYFWRP